MVKVPIQRQIPIAVPSRERVPTEQIIIKEVDVDERRNKYRRGSDEDYGRGFGNRIGRLGEASWIQEGLDKALNQDKQPQNPYKNALALENANFFHGYGQMMGDVSNLGFDSYSHDEYINNVGTQKETFNKNFRNFMENYDGQNNLLKQYEVVAPDTASLHPDYENWYKIGQKYNQELQY